MSAQDETLALAPPSGHAPTAPASQTCAGLADAGWKSKCVQVSTGTTTLTGLIETKTGPNGYNPLWQASVWVQRGSTLTETLHAGTPDDQFYWEWINMASSDVLVNGHHELLFGFENNGTGAILDIEAVSADGTSVLGNQKISIYKGSATVNGNQVVTYHPIYRDNDANCCPSGGDGSDTVTFGHGSWAVTASHAVSPPPGDQPFPDDFPDPHL